MKYLRAISISILGALLSFSGAVHAQLTQLQLTEVMVHSIDDTNFEWIEVRNAGSTDGNLSGYLLGGGDNDPISGSNISSPTVIPAGGVAVLYNSDGLGGNVDPDAADARFRAAWPLAEEALLIPVASWPSLANSDNSGARVGLWQTQSTYDMDVDTLPGMDGMLGTADDVDRVVQTTNAAAGIDFTLDNNFPPISSRSISWTGIGTYVDGSKWTATPDVGNPVSPTLTSVQTNLPQSSINNTSDLGNPGAVSAYASLQTTGLVITELMINGAPEPNAIDNDFEWVELFNNTGDDINFASTPYTFDDDDGLLLSDANITSGTIPDGAVAILFDLSEMTASQMETAWGTGPTYIGVSNWPDLADGDDVIGFWEGTTDYENELGDQNMDGAVVSFSYFNDGTNFPNDVEGLSIHLDGTAAAAAGFVEPWVHAGQSESYSRNPEEVLGAPLVDHAGNFLGSPGTFGSGLDCDLDGNGQCDSTDLEALAATVGTGDPVVEAGVIVTWLDQASAANNPYLGGIKTFVMGDANLDGNVDSDDLGLLLNNFNSTTELDWLDGNLNGDAIVDSVDLGLMLNNFNHTSPEAPQAQAVPEPGSVPLMLLALFGLVAYRRRAA